MALAPQQFCVRWNSYHSNLQTVFPKLLSTENFADVTLACENRQLRCHKVVLSACSAYFERLLVQNPCKHPIIFMKDMRFSEMQSLVDFMYKGEVNVTQDDLPSLLKSAEALQIRGLCSSEAGGAEAAPAAKGTQTSDGRDFTLASEALLRAQLDCADGGGGGGGGAARQPERAGGPCGKKRRAEGAPAPAPTVKEETVEEDGLFYGELDNDDIEFNEDEDTDKPSGSLAQPSGDAVFYPGNVKSEDVVRTTSTEIFRRHFIDIPDFDDDGIPMNIHARPRIMGRRPNAIVNIETDVFQEKSYKQYSSQHLREALIAVKKGFSVYAASNKYGVPRKTLRNWMEKYDIKSQFSKGRRGIRNPQILDPLGLMTQRGSELYSDPI